MRRVARRLRYIVLCLSGDRQQASLLVCLGDL